MHTNYTTQIAAFSLVLLGLAYLYWLDYGCPLTGVMTWSGKVCF